MKPKRDAINNARYQGIAVALTALSRDHMEPDLARLVGESLGVTLQDFKEARVEDYDLEELQKIFGH